MAVCKVTKNSPNLSTKEVKLKLEKISNERVLKTFLNNLNNLNRKIDDTYINERTAHLFAISYSLGKIELVKYLYYLKNNNTKELNKLLSNYPAFGILEDKLKDEKIQEEVEKFYEQFKDELKDNLTEEEVEKIIYGKMSSQKGFLEELSSSNSREPVNNEKSLTFKKEEENEKDKKEKTEKTIIFNTKPASDFNYSDVFDTVNKNLIIYEEDGQNLLQSGLLDELGLTKEDLAPLGILENFEKDEILGTNKLRNTNVGKRAKNTIGFLVKKFVKPEGVTDIKDFLNGTKGNPNYHYKSIIGFSNETGRPLSEEEQQKVLDAFIKVNTAIARKIKETVLSEDKIKTLSIVKEIGLNKSALPLKFALALQNIIEKELGIKTEVVKSRYFKNISKNNNNSSGLLSEEDVPVFGLRVHDISKKNKAEREQYNNAGLSSINIFNNVLITFKGSKSSSNGKGNFSSLVNEEGVYPKGLFDLSNTLLKSLENIHFFYPKSEKGADKYTNLTGGTGVSKPTLVGEDFIYFGLKTKEESGRKAVLIINPGIEGREFVINLSKDVLKNDNTDYTNAERQEKLKELVATVKKTITKNEQTEESYTAEEIKNNTDGVLVKLYETINSYVLNNFRRKSKAQKTREALEKDRPITHTMKQDPYVKKGALRNAIKSRKLREEMVKSFSDSFVFFLEKNINKRLESLKKLANPSKDIAREIEIYESAKSDLKKAYVYYLNNSTEKYTNTQGKKVKGAGNIIIEQILDTYRALFKFSNYEDFKSCNEEFKDNYFVTEIENYCKHVENTNKAYYDSFTSKGGFPQHVFEKVQEVYRALTEKVGERIELNEDAIKDLIDSSKFKLEDLINIKLNVDNKASITSEEIQEELQEEDNEDSEADQRSGLGIIKYMMMDPEKTIGKRVKSLFSSLYEVMRVNGNVVFVRSENTKFRRRANFGYVYINFLKAMQDCYDSSQFDTLLDKACEGNPIFLQIKEACEKDKTLKSELYAATKHFCKFAIIPTKGQIKTLNEDASVNAILDELSRTADSRIIISKHSLYDTSGFVNLRSIKYWKNRLGGYNVIMGFLRGDDAISERFLEKLTEEDSEGYNIFEGMLRAIGINTENLNTDSVVPLTYKNFKRYYVDSIKDKNEQASYLALLDREDRIEKELESDEEKEENENKKQLKDRIKESLEEKDLALEENLEKEYMAYCQNFFANPEIVKKLKAIYDSFEKITGFLESETYFSVSKIINQYRSIANALKFFKSGINSTNFNFAGNKRYSYIAWNKVAILIKKIQLMSDEEFEDFIEKEYEQYDFYVSKTEEGNVKGKESVLSWLRALRNNKKLREKIDYYNVLGIHGNTEKDTIQNVNEETTILGTIQAYLASLENQNNMEISEQVVPFRTPLPSDTDICLMVNGPRSVNPKNDVSSILRTELNRILYYTSDEGSTNEIGIDFFNNNTKFCIFPYLNKEGITVQISSSEIESNPDYTSLEKLLKNDKELFKFASISKDSKGNITLEFKNGESIINFYKSNSRIKANVLDLISEQILKNQFNKFLDYLKKVNDDSPRQNTIKKLIECINNYTKNISRTDVDVIEDEYSIGYNPQDDLIDDIFGSYAPSEEQTQSMMDILKDEEADEHIYLKDFIYQDFVAQLNIGLLLNGDPAQFKNAGDWVKRSKENVVGGTRPYGKSVNNDTLVNVALYVEDLVRADTSYKSIRDMFESIAEDPNTPAMEKELMRTYIKMYEKVTETDGQAYRTVDSFKKILEAAGGQWTVELENAFKRIKNKHFTAYDFGVILNAAKPFATGSETVKLKGGRTEKVSFQYKNSESPLVAAFGAISLVLQDSIELTALQEVMEKRGIDVVQFHSCVKHGYHSGVRIDYNKSIFESDAEFEARKKSLLEKLKNNEITQQQYNIALKLAGFEMLTLEDIKYINSFLEENDTEFSNVLKELKITEKLSTDLNAHKQSRIKQLKNQIENQIESYKDADGKSTALHESSLDTYYIMQPTEDHLVDRSGVFGVQLSNVIVADLVDKKDGKEEVMMFTLNFGGQKINLSSKAIVTIFNILETDQQIDSYKKLEERFSNPEKLSNYLEDLMRKNPQYTEDIIESIKTKNGELITPLNAPHLSNKIPTLVLSAFKNNIQRQLIEGGNAVLLANVGRTSSLQVKYKNDDYRQGIEYIPAYLPASFATLYKDCLVQDESGYCTIDFKKLKELEGNEGCLTDIIGYRIPTEDKYSIVPIRVVGFLPSYASSSIMLPSTIITMSGTDFDIDKLFIMKKSLTRTIVSKDGLSKSVNDIIDILSNPKSSNKGLRGLLINNLVKYYKKSLKGKSNEEIEKWIKNEFIKNVESIKDDIDKIQVTAGRISDKDAKKLSEKHQILSFIFTSKISANGDSLENFKEKQKLNSIVKNGQKTLYYELRPKLNEDIKKKLKVLAEEELTTEEADKILVDIVKEVSKLSNVKNTKLKKSIRNNMMIDIIRTILTNPSVTPQVLTPGQFEPIKFEARINEILNSNSCAEYVKSVRGDKSSLEYLKSLSYNGLVEILEKFKEPDDMFSFTDSVRNKKNLMDGKALIGIFALSRSVHDKLQHFNIKLKDSCVFKVKTSDGSVVTITDVDPVFSPITGRRVSGVLKESQAASPDNGKDPCLGSLGLNTKNAYLYNFVVKVGFDSGQASTILMLNNSSIVLEKLAKEIYSKDNTAFQEKKNETDENRNKELFVFELDEIRELLVDLANGRLSINKNKAEIIKLIEHLNAFKRTIKPAARDYQKVQKVARVDSVNGAIPSDLGGALELYMDILNLKREIGTNEFNIQGIEKFLDLELQPSKTSRETILEKEEGLTKMQSSYTYGILGPFVMLKTFFPQISIEMADGLEELIKYTKFDKLPTNIINNWLNKFTSFCLSGKSLFGNEIVDDKLVTLLEKRNYYINDFPVNLLKSLKLKDEETGEPVHPDLVKNEFIKKLANEPGKGISFKLQSALRSEDRKEYAEAAEELVNSEDAEVRRIGIDLFMYGYYFTCLNYTYKNYVNMFSTTYLQNAVPNYLEELKEVNREFNDDINGSIKMKEDIKVYNIQYLLNNPGLLPTRKLKKGLMPIVKGNNGTYEFTRKTAENLSLFNVGSTPLQLVRFIEEVETVEKDKDGKEKKNVENVYTTCIFVGLKNDTAIYRKVQTIEDSLNGLDSPEFYDYSKKCSDINGLSDFIDFTKLKEIADFDSDLQKVLGRENRENNQKVYYKEKNDENLFNEYEEDVTDSFNDNNEENSEETDENTNTDLVIEEILSVYNTKFPVIGTVYNTTATKNDNIDIAKKFIEDSKGDIDRAIRELEERLKNEQNLSKKEKNKINEIIITLETLKKVNDQRKKAQTILGQFQGDSEKIINYLENYLNNKKDLSENQKEKIENYINDLRIDLAIAENNLDYENVTDSELIARTTNANAASALRMLQHNFKEKLRKAENIVCG